MEANDARRGGLSAAAEWAPGLQATDKSEDARRAAKAAARRARYSSTAGDRNALYAPPNVLVYDRDGESCDRICQLLEGFGFCAYPANDVAQARWLAVTQPFAAAFIELQFDAPELGDCLDLCDCIKSDAADGFACALIILFSAANPADRVRARLAGGDASIAKPPGRGDLARALEDCRVLLPSDARRS